MMVFARRDLRVPLICGAAGFVFSAGQMARADPPAALIEIPVSPATLFLDDSNGSPSSAPAAPPPYPLTGDWWGTRRTLDQHGITFAGSVFLDATRTLTGGLKQDKTALQYLLELSANVDTEKLWGIHGGTFFIDFENHNGSNPSPELVGDLQNFDGNDAGHFTQIDQLWYQQLLAGDKLRIKLGKIDANADFSLIEHGKEFLNSSPSYSPTIFPMVTYPDPAPGGEFFWNPSSLFYAGVAAFYSNQHQTFLDFAGHPSAIEREAGGAFMIGEAGARWTLPGNLVGHAGIGGWGHTGTFPDFHGGHAEGTGGGYFFADQSLFHEAANQPPDRDLGVFFQYGLSDPSVSPIAEHIGGGLAATGVIPGRSADIFGIGPTWVRLGDFHRDSSDEFALEAFYKLQLTRWMNFKPDLQYIRHPGGMDVGDALVFTLRAEVDF